MSLLQHLFPALVVTSLLGLTPSARAQLNVQVMTVERVNVWSSVAGVTRSATVAAPQLVTPSLNAFVSHNSTNYARVRSTLTTAFDGFAWNYRTTAAASSPSLALSSARAEGALRLRATWTGPGVLLARVRVTVAADLSPSGSALVDVGDDGTNDAGANPFFYRPTYERVIQLGAGGIYIRARAHESANAGGLVPSMLREANIVVELEPVQIVEVGEPCGPNLSGVLRAGGSHGLLDLYATGAPPTTWGMFAVGSSPAAIPLPPTGCMIYVDAASYHPVPVSAAGTVRVLNTRLPAVLGLGLYFQFLAPDYSTPRNDWYTSQALWVTAF